MDKQLFEQLVSDIKAANKAKNRGKSWTFGTKPAEWVGLLNLADGLIDSAADSSGNVVVDARHSEMLLRDLQQLGEKLRAIALGADASKVFGQQAERKPDQQMQQLNYAVTYWRARASGLKAETAVYVAQCHFPGFEPPTKETLQRYARTHRVRAFEILEAEGVDVTKLREQGLARAKRGKSGG